MDLQPRSCGADLARTFGTLWAAVFFDQSSNLHRPATPEAVAAFEAQAGLTLPPSHREFLLRADGGQAGYILYSAAADERGDTFAWHQTHTRPDLERSAGRPVFPFARSWGGDYYCQDLSRPRGEGDYPILCWNHAAADRGDSPAEIWSEVAPGFLEFLAWGLNDPVSIPAIVATEARVELHFGDVCRAAIEWPQVRQIAVEVVIDEDYCYSEAFWWLTGPGAEFRAPVGMATGAERFEAHLVALRGFEVTAYQKARAAAARVDPGVFECLTR